MRYELALAKAISFVLHPAFLPTIGTFLLFNLNSYLTYRIDPSHRSTLYILIFLNTTLFPGLITYLLFRMGKIKSIELHERKERRIPFLITAIFYFITYYLLRNAQLPHIFLIMLLGATLSVLLAFIINLVWKISAHMIGIGGITGAALALSIRLQMDLMMPLAIMIIIAGMVATARLILRAHTPAQLWLGFLTGFLCQLGLILFF